MITIGSVKPTGPMPVQPTTSAPVPWPPCTRVPQIHSRWRGQSTAACHTRSGSASTVTWAAIWSAVGMPPDY